MTIEKPKWDMNDLEHMDTNKLIETPEDAEKVLEEAKIFRDAGHQVRVRKKFSGELKIDSDLIIIDASSVDPTQRGLDISMSFEDKLKRFLVLKEVNEDEHEEYVSVISHVLAKQEIVNAK